MKSAKKIKNTESVELESRSPRGKLKKKGNMQKGPKTIQSQSEVSGSEHVMQESKPQKSNKKLKIHTEVPSPTLRGLQPKSPKGKTIGFGTGQFETGSRANVIGNGGALKLQPMQIAGTKGFDTYEGNDDTYKNTPKGNAKEGKPPKAGKNIFNKYMSHKSPKEKTNKRVTV